MVWMKFVIGLLFIENISKLKIIIGDLTHVHSGLPHSCQMAIEGIWISNGELKCQQSSGPASISISCYTNQEYPRFLLESV